MKRQTAEDVRPDTDEEKDSASVHRHDDCAIIKPQKTIEKNVFFCPLPWSTESGENPGESVTVKPFIRISQIREKKAVFLPGPETRFYGISVFVIFFLDACSLRRIRFSFVGRRK